MTCQESHLLLLSPCRSTIPTLVCSQVRWTGDYFDCVGLHVKSRAHNILYLKLRTYTAEAQSELALADYAQASLYYSILFFTPLFFTYYCFHCSYYTSTMLTDVSFKMTNWQHFTGDYSKVNIFRGLYCNTASFPALQGKVGNCNILAISSGKSTSNMQESLPIRLA